MTKSMMYTIWDGLDGYPETDKIVASFADEKTAKIVARKYAKHEVKKLCNGYFKPFTRFYRDGSIEYGFYRWGEVHERYVVTVNPTTVWL